MLMQNFFFLLGGGGANKVHYGKCGSGVYDNSFYRLEHNFVCYLCFLAMLSTRFHENVHVF